MIKISKRSFTRFVSNSKSAQKKIKRKPLTVSENISLPSTAITAGMVHNIHRISIIGHLYCPDIQIKYVPKAIDSAGREGTGGPSPPIERSQIAARATQIWTKFGRNQKNDRRRGAPGNAVTLPRIWATRESGPMSLKNRNNNLLRVADGSGVIIFELSIRPRVKGIHYPLQSHFQCTPAVNPREAPSPRCLT